MGVAVFFEGVVLIADASLATRLDMNIVICQIACRARAQGSYLSIVRIDIRSILQAEVACPAHRKSLFHLLLDFQPRLRIIKLFFFDYGRRFSFEGTACACLGTALVRTEQDVVLA